MPNRALVRLATTAAAFALLAPSGHAEPLGNPLTPEQVACDADRFRRLLWLTDAGAGGVGDRPWTLFVSPHQSRDYALLAVANQWPMPVQDEPLAPHREPELQLAASLGPAFRPIANNPARRAAPAVMLVRDNANSTRQGGTLGLVFFLNTFFDRSQGLVVETDGRAVRRGLFSEMNPFHPFEACHDLLTDEDRLVLSVLQRVVRPRSEALAVGDVNAGNQEVAIYRDEEPDRFVVDVYMVSYIHPAPTGPARFYLALDRDDQGRLSTAHLELPNPAAYESRNNDLTDAFFIPPVHPSREVWLEEGAEAVRLRVPDDFYDGPVTVDLGALLAGSAWNPPRN